MLLSQDDFHNYQNISYNFIKDKDFAALYLDMGLGKTVVSATWIADNFFNYNRFLIVAPKFVCLNTWKKEFLKWSHLNFLYDESEIVTGEVGKETRERLIRGSTKIIIINYENLIWLMDYEVKKLKRWSFDAIIFDEYDSMKNIVKRTRRFYNIRKGFTRKGKLVQPIKAIIGLTGTPVTTGAHNMYMQMKLLDMGDRLGGTDSAFTRKWLDLCPYTRKKTLKPHMKELFFDRISELCLSMKSEDYLDLPDFIYNKISIPVPADVMTINHKLENDYIAEVKGKDVVVTQGSALRTKLNQIANGFVYYKDNPEDMEEKPKCQHVSDFKIDALKDLILGVGEENVIVVYYFKEDLAMIKKHIKGAVIFKEDADAVDKWNDGKIKILVMHASNNSGLNMQDGGHHLIWFAQVNALRSFLQMNKRLLRQGQKNNVFVHQLISEGTVDELICANRDAHNLNQEEFMKAIEANPEIGELSQQGLLRAIENRRVDNSVNIE